ncbi:hypothetical protein LCGC14_2955400 [marine sediment metagenome]|uniref:HNH nuclease domain-containing protein n=1 Tax=marine sediment metagenome TaxID=412755 RepID=A0A0F8ZLL7_9ZZZZ
MVSIRAKAAPDGLDQRVGGHRERIAEGISSHTSAPLPLEASVRGYGGVLSPSLHPAEQLIRGLVVKKQKRLRYATHTMRKRIYKRDAGQCQYCGVEVSIQECNFDHVIPFTGGGSTNQMNLVVCCRDCNELKYAQLIPAELRPRTGHSISKKLKQRRKPRRRFIKLAQENRDRFAMIRLADGMGVYIEDLFKAKTLRHVRR